jgi:hypothetical protein
MRGNAARLVSTPALCLCKSRARIGLLLVRDGAPDVTGDAHARIVIAGRALRVGPSATPSDFSPPGGEGSSAD